MRRIPLVAVMVLAAALSACGPFVRTVDVGPQGTVGGIAVHSASGMVYVANYDGASITRFPNGGGAKVIIPTPAKPSGVAVVQKTGNVFVPSEAEGTLTVLEHDDAVVATLPVCAGPVAVAALDSENLVFVSCRDSQELAGVFGGDGASALPKVVFRVPLPSRPADVAVLNPSRSAFVVLKHDDPSAPERIGHFRYVPIGAGATVSLTRTIDLPDAPLSIAGNSHTQEVLVGLRNGRIALIDGTENHTDVHYTIVRSFPVDTGNEAIVASKLAINEGSDDLLMAYGERRQSGSSRVDSRTPISGTSVIDVVDERRLPMVSSVAFPGAAAADPATGRFYVTSIMANTVVELTDPAYQDNLVLPVRWCVLQGSAMAKSVTVPAGQDAVWPSPAIGDELADLMGQVTNQVWWPSGAHISFFAAAASDVPVIIDAEHAAGTCRNDARPPELRSGDCPGDIDGTGGFGQGGEADRAGTLCRAAWAERFPHTKGPIAIFARDLSNTSDTGHTVTPPDISNSPALCQAPRTVTAFQLPSEVVVHDVAQFQGAAYDQITNVAHEFGHALLLGHGNGVDDNDPKPLPLSPGPRWYDEYCDAAEPTVGSDRNLMGPSAGDYRTLTALQVETARDIVHAYFNPPPRCIWKRNCH